MKLLIGILFAVIGLAVTFGGLYLAHGKDRRGLIDLDAYRRGEGQK